MTSSELRYLITVDEISQENKVVKQSDLASRLNVTKVSAFNAIERLCEKNYITKINRKLMLTDKAIKALLDYRLIINFMVLHLKKHCGTPGDIAYQDAINATCAISDAAREGIARYLEKLDNKLVIE